MSLFHISSSLTLSKAFDYKRHKKFNALIRCNRIKFLCIPGSLNTNIIHRLEYTITFVNSQRENTNSKGDIVLKNKFETFVLKISGKQKINQTQIWYDEFSQ